MSNETKSKKMSFVSGMFMSIGSIIGAGIFASTPVAIKIVGGNGVVWGFILGALFLFVKSMPGLVMTSALPASGASYMQLTRLVHPGFGMLDAINMLVTGPMKVATMSLTFSTYFCLLFPQVSEIWAAALCVIAFTVLSTYGLKASTTVQNVAVVILIIALGLYIFYGVPASTISFMDVLLPTVTVVKMWAAMGILHGSLMGANVLIYCADEVEDPGKNIPIIFLASTMFCAVFYAMIAYVTVGSSIPWFQIKNLADVAGTFMTPAMLTFFITGGALLAVVTSINSTILMFSRAHFVASRDLYFPQAICKMNKHGAPANSIWLNSIIALVFIIGGFNLSDVTMITSIPGLLMNPIGFIPILLVMRKYPLSYKNCFLNFPHWLNCTFAVVASVLSIVMGASVVSQMSVRNWMSMVIFYSAAIVYTIWRINYLKGKEINLLDNMGKGHDPWDKREEMLRAKIEAKAEATAK